MANSTADGQQNDHGRTRNSNPLIDIFALLNRYAYTARDHLDWDKLGEFFHPTAKVQLGNGKVIPHAEMRKLVPADPPKYLRHHITAIDVNFKSEREAVANVQWFATTDLSPRDHWGEWHDTVSVDVDGAWVIMHKVIEFEGMDPNGVAASMAVASK